MSNVLARRPAAMLFAQGGQPKTACALTFVGNVAYSYSEPIAVRRGGKLYVTTARFSMTTSHHRGCVAGSYAVVNGSDMVVDTDHGTIRDMTREENLSCGPWGRQYDTPHGANWSNIA